MEVLRDILKLPVWEAMFWIGLGLIVVSLLFSEVRVKEQALPIRRRPLIFIVGVLLLVASFVLIRNPDLALKRLNAAQVSTEDYALDVGLIRSVFFSSDGQFQVQLEGGFPVAKHKAIEIWGTPLSDYDWPIGDHLPDRAKDALVAANVTGTPVQILVRRPKPGDTKFRIDHVYIGLTTSGPE